MTVTALPLRRLIRPAKVERAAGRELPILSMTMRDGLVEQASKFKKRIASGNTSDYKVVSRNQLVVGFPIDEGVLSFQDLYDKAIVSPAYDVWDLSVEREVEPQYLELFLRSPLALRFYARKLRGTTARRRTLPDDVFLALEVPLPSAPEQGRIVDILNKADGIRRKRKEALALTEQLLRSAFMEMFGDPVTNPKGWDEVTIGDWAIRVTKGESPGWQGFEYQEEGVRFVTSENVRFGRLDLSKSKFIPPAFDKKIERSRLQEDDVLINLVGASIGRAALASRECLPANVNQAVAVVSLNRDGMIPDFLLHQILVPGLQARLLGNIVAAARANISLTNIRELKVIRPPLREQIRWTDFVSRLNTAQSHYVAAIDESEQLFASLGYHTFHGELTGRENATGTELGLCVGGARPGHEGGGK